MGFISLCLQMLLHGMQRNFINGYPGNSTYNSLYTWSYQSQEGKYNTRLGAYPEYVGHYPEGDLRAIINLHFASEDLPSEVDTNTSSETTQSEVAAETPTEVSEETPTSAVATEELAESSAATEVASSTALEVTEGAAETTELAAETAGTGGLGAIVAAGQMTGMLLNGYLGNQNMVNIENTYGSQMEQAKGYGQSNMLTSFYKGQEQAQSAKTSLGGLLSFGAGPLGALIAQSLPNNMFSNPTVNANIADYSKPGVTASQTSTQMQIGQDAVTQVKAYDPITPSNYQSTGGNVITPDPISAAGAILGTVD